MGDFALLDAVVGDCSPGDAAASRQTLVTGSATIDTKGSWAVVVASTGEPVDGFLLCFAANIDTSAAQRGCLVDVGIAPVGGAAGTESVIVADMLYAQHTGFTNAWIPRQVPKGYRISVRLAGSTASQAARIGIITVAGGMAGLDGAMSSVTYGAVAAGSTGAVLTTATVVNTKSVWTVLSASMSHAARWISVFAGGPATATNTAAFALIDVGYGAAGLEVPYLRDLPMDISLTEQSRFCPVTVPFSAPAGTRLVARYQATSIAVTAKPALTVVTYG